MPCEANSPDSPRTPSAVEVANAFIQRCLARTVPTGHGCSVQRLPDQSVTERATFTARGSVALWGVLHGSTVVHGATHYVHGQSHSIGLHCTD